jgi:ketopantoate reductase
MDYAVLGAGAVGTLVGGLLAHQGHRVLFCSHGAAADVSGPDAKIIRLRLPRKRIVVREISVPAAGKPERNGREAVDYLLVALKRHDLKKLLPDFPAGLPVRPRQGVLFFNNPGEHPAADAPVSSDCLTLLNAVLLQPWDVEVTSPRAVLIYAKNSGIGGLLNFKSLGFETLEVQDLKPYANSFFLWQLLFLPPALCHSTAGHFLSYPEGREIACRLLEEGLETFRRAGENLEKLPWMDPRELMRRMKRRPGDFTAARRDPDRGYNPLLQSLLRGRKTEVGELNRRLVRLASGVGVNASWNWRLAEKLEHVRRLDFYKDPAELFQAVK